MTNLDFENTDVISNLTFYEKPVNIFILKTAKLVLTASLIEEGAARTALARGSARPSPTED